MGDDDQCPALPLQVGKDLRVEQPPERWVLLRRPFIEHDNRPSFKIDLHQRQTLALARLKIGGRETVAVDCHLVVDFKLLQVIPGALRD